MSNDEEDADTDRDAVARSAGAAVIGSKWSEVLDWQRSTDQDLYGHRGQPGRLDRMEAMLKEHAHTIDGLKGLTWKIVTAAALAGVATSVIVGVIRWAFER
mgnify:CR=1 FL=1|jgi:hypothetical protein